MLNSTEHLFCLFHTLSRFFLKLKLSTKTDFTTFQRLRTNWSNKYFVRLFYTNQFQWKSIRIITTFWFIRIKFAFSLINVKWVQNWKTTVQCFWRSAQRKICNLDCEHTQNWSRLLLNVFTATAAIQINQISIIMSNK